MPLSSITSWECFKRREVYANLIMSHNLSPIHGQIRLNQNTSHRKCVHGLREKVSLFKTRRLKNKLSVEPFLRDFHIVRALLLCK